MTQIQLYPELYLARAILVLSASNSKWSHSRYQRWSNLAPAEMEDNEEAKGAKEYEKEESSFKVEVNHSHSTENEGMVKILIPL